MSQNTRTLLEKTPSKETIDEAVKQVSQWTPPVIIEAIAHYIEIAREARRRVAEEGVVVRDMRGSVVPHPGIDIAKSAFNDAEKIISKHAK